LSRLQRDLTDSFKKYWCTNGTYLNRFEATLKGLNKLLLNEPKFHEDLENWAVVAEAIQTILRRKDILIRMKP
jgi:adenylosuccinate lyase